MNEPIAFGDTRPLIAVSAPADWRHLITALFPEHVVQPGPAPESIEVVLAGEGGRLETRRGPQEAENHQDLLALVEIHVTRALLRASGHMAHLHASGTIAHGGALLALGRAGAGKSSLALAWHRMGLRLLGDDTVFIDGSSRARPFRRLMKLEVDRLRAADIDPEATLAWDPCNAEAWFTPGPEGWAEKPAPVTVVARIHFHDGADLELTRLSAPETLNVLMHSLLASGAAGERVLPRLARVAEHAKGFDVRFGDSTEAAASLADGTLC